MGGIQDQQLIFLEVFPLMYLLCCSVSSSTQRLSCRPHVCFNAFFVSVWVTSKWGLRPILLRCHCIFQSLNANIQLLLVKALSKLLVMRSSLDQISKEKDRSFGRKSLQQKMVLLKAEFCLCFYKDHISLRHQLEFFLFCFNSKKFDFHLNHLFPSFIFKPK